MLKCTHPKRRLLVAVLAITALLGVRPANSEPLRVHPTNPRYLTIDGHRAIYLTGSHTWLNFQDGGPTDPPEPFDYEAYLDFLERHHHNFIRLWSWEGTSWVWSQPQTPAEFAVLAPSPFRRTGPGMANDGKPRFDVTKFNEAYFGRLRDRVRAAKERGIYVGVKLFEGFSVAAKSRQKKQQHLTPWVSHSFNAANNVNGLDGDPNHDGDGYEVHTLAIPEITRVQESYVRRVIDAVNEFDNVIYEIANECHGGSTEWQYHMIRFIRDYEKSKPKQHLTWMSFQWDGFDRGDNRALFEGPADVVSPATQDGAPYENDPPPADGSKVVILDTDHINPRDRRRVAWVWKTFTRGMHAILMDDPFGNVKRDEEMEGAEATRRAMGEALRFAERMNLAAMTPATDAATCSTRYCLANPGAEYLAYQPGSGPFTLKLPAGDYLKEWFDPTHGRTAATGEVKSPGGRQTFTPPIDGPAVLYLKAAK